MITFDQAFKYLKKYGHEIGNKAHAGDPICKSIRDSFQVYLNDPLNEYKKNIVIENIERYKKTIC